MNWKSFSTSSFVLLKKLPLSSLCLKQYVIAVLTGGDLILTLRFCLLGSSSSLFHQSLWDHSQFRDVVAVVARRKFGLDFGVFG